MLNIQIFSLKFQSLNPDPNKVYPYDYMKYLLNLVSLIGHFFTLFANASEFINNKESYVTCRVC